MGALLKLALAAVWASSSSSSSPEADGALDRVSHKIVLDPAAAAAAALAASAPAGAQGSSRERGEAEHDEDSPLFRDFGVMSMYDAEELYDPLVLSCAGGSSNAAAAAVAAARPCCGDGQCQQHCLGDQQTSAAAAAACVGGHEQRSNCPQDCAAATASRRQFELSTDQPQVSSLFSGLESEILHPVRKRVFCAILY